MAVILVFLILCCAALWFSIGTITMGLVYRFTNLEEEPIQTISGIAAWPYVWLFVLLAFVGNFCRIFVKKIAGC